MRLSFTLYSRFVRFFLSRPDLHDLWDLSTSFDRSVILSLVNVYSRLSFLQDRLPLFR